MTQKQVHHQEAHLDRSDTPESCHLSFLHNQQAASQVPQISRQLRVSSNSTTLVFSWNKVEEQPSTMSQVSAFLEDILSTSRVS